MKKTKTKPVPSAPPALPRITFTIKYEGVELTNSGELLFWDATCTTTELSSDGPWGKLMADVTATLKIRLDPY